MNISTIISPYFYIRSDIDLQGDAELTITGFLIGFASYNSSNKPAPIIINIPANMNLLAGLIAAFAF
ncbi:hypothetical protein D9G41_17740 [Escherichia coli]|nr:hypothetical protein [Escherichia coli]